MNRLFIILSLLSFLTFVGVGVLMLVGTLNPIVHLKYLLVLFSLFLTILSVGLFTFRQEVSQLQYGLLLFLLIFPLFIPTMGLFSPETLAKYWYLFAGGVIFQVGTGINALVGGFIKHGISVSLKYLSVINYLLFIFLAVILFFEIRILMEAYIFVITGVLASVSSLWLVVKRKPTLSL